MIPLRFVPLLVLFGIAPNIAVAQGASHAEPWFSVTISTPEASVRAGSDVKLNVVFVNNTGKDLGYGVGGPGRDGPAFDIDIRDNEGKTLPETPHGLKRQGKGSRPPFSGSVFRATVHPGETVKEELILSKEYDLGKPDKYTVQVRGKNFQTVKSNIVTITVSP